MENDPLLRHVRLLGFFAPAPSLLKGREDALAEVRGLVDGRTPAKRRGRPKKVAAKPAKRKKKRRNPWDHMTPAQRKERVRKMLAGRGLKPTTKRRGTKKG